MRGGRVVRDDPLGGHRAGERVGGKVLVEYAGRDAHRIHLWWWASDCCGIRQGPSSISHMSRSQRCRACSRKRENNGRWLGHEQISGSFLYQYRHDARTRGLAWEVTPEQLWAKWVEQEGCCAYTGWPLEHGVNASIDRIDSTVGYLLGNVHWVHRDVNWAKRDFTERYFLTLCAAVAGAGV